LPVRVSPTPGAPERRRPSDDGSNLSLVEIAELLGVSKQRAHQIAEEKGFPSRVGREGQSRVWDRRVVTAWAKAWRNEKPWR
jgi:predicted DNA-binding transcriptional regulator AlpA